MLLIRKKEALRKELADHDDEAGGADGQTDSEANFAAVHEYSLANFSILELTRH